MNAKEPRRRISIEAHQMRRRTRQAKREVETTELQLKRREAQRDWVRILLQALAGAAVLIGLAITWVQLSDARAEASRQQAATSRQLDTALSGQLTDRFGRAVDQLGNSEAVDVRIGGIYALERIAQDSKRDRRTVAEVLSAFVVRASTSTAPAVASDSPGSDAPFDRMPDVRAAMTVIARMYPPGERTPFDLSGADLRLADLTGAVHFDVPARRRLRHGLHRRDPWSPPARAQLEAEVYAGWVLGGAGRPGPGLRGAVLDGADLRYAVLTGADLRDADLRYADLRTAQLGGADLRDAVLTEADLAGADLFGADLANAGLYGAVLGHTVLLDADLRGADLRFVVLTGADLHRADLSRSDLRAADLRRADITRAVLDDAVLDGADLRGADLRRAVLTGADLRYAELGDAWLDGADLRDSRVDYADLDGACFSRTTIWPVGFDPTISGASLDKSCHTR